MRDKLTAEAMQAFVHQPNLEALFRCYWEEYVSRLPEAVFTHSDLSDSLKLRSAVEQT